MSGLAVKDLIIPSLWKPSLGSSALLDMEVRKLRVDYRFLLCDWFL